MDNQSKKKFSESRNLPAIIIAVALLLVAVMVFNFVANKPVIAQAAPGKLYVQDVRILTCLEKEFNDESRKLRAEGYIVDKNYNFGDQEEGENMLDSPNDERAYLAYKTTRDPRNAITDFSVMNMKGPYSFAEYDKLLEQQKATADNLVNNLNKGVVLFRSNYEAKTPAALYAHKMLNNFIEEDSGKRMGDFLLDVDLTSGALRKVALEAQTIIFSQVLQWVAIACATIAGQDDWLTKLSNMTQEEIEFETTLLQNDKGAQNLLKTFGIMNADYVKYDEYFNELQEAFGGEPYNPEDADEKATYESIVAKYYKNYDDLTLVESTYGVLATLPYSSDKYSYSPYGEFIGENAGKGAMVNLVLDYDNLDYEDLYAMSSTLTEAQHAMIYVAGLVPFITSALNTEKYWADVQKEVESVAVYNFDNPNEEPPATSIYSGVDRSLFDSEGIALTDEAARRGFIDSTDSWLYGNVPLAVEWVLYGAMILGGIGMIGGAAYSYAKSGSLFTTYNNHWESSLNKAAKYKAQGRTTAGKVGKFALIENKAGTKSQWFVRDYLVCTKNVIGGAVFAGAMFLVMLAVTIYMIIELVYYNKKDYTTIPRIIINNFSKNDKSVYVKYNAVLNQKGEFADISKSGREWVVPYISRDPNAGHPIVADFVLKRSGSASFGASYSPMRRIGDEVRFNAHTNSSADPLYFGFKRDADAYPKTTASTFSAGSFTLALCGGIILGGALGWLATYLVIRKKRKNKESLVVINTSEKE